MSNHYIMPVLDRAIVLQAVGQATGAPLATGPALARAAAQLQAEAALRSNDDAR